MECPNCKQTIAAAEVMAHTVMCYRSSTKCKVCNEVIQKNNKKGHLDKWRSKEVTTFAVTTLGAVEIDRQ